MSGVGAARVELVPFPVKIKIKVKGSGQGCPLHTIEIPTSRKEREKWGTQRPLYTSKILCRMPTKVDSTFVDFTGFQERGKVG
jgi:hypothetical protein